MTEEELLARFKKGDLSAFEEIVKANQDKVYAVALRLCKNEQDAEDASQEAFLKLYKALPSFREQSRLSTYLYRIVSNVCLDKMRERRENFSLTEEEGKETDVADDTYNPEKTVLQKERTQLLENAIQSLSYEHREMITLREIEGLSYQEIADITSLPVNTVRTRILRARESLKEKLLKNGNFFAEYASNEEKGSEKDA